MYGEDDDDEDEGRGKTKKTKMAFEQLVPIWGVLLSLEFAFAC